MNKKIKNTVFIATAAILLSFLFHLFVAQIISYKKNNMANTIPKGSWVLIKKYSHIKKGDWVAFLHDNQIFISRIAASGSDKIEISKANTLVNGVNIEKKLRRFFIYQIQSDAALANKTTKNAIILSQQNISGLYHTQLILTPAYANKIRKMQGILSVCRINRSLADNTNIDFYPIKQTGNKNSYFVLNDFRNDMRDSRSWGYISADRIIGKAVLLKSLFLPNH